MKKMLKTKAGLAILLPVLVALLLLPGCDLLDGLFDGDSGEPEPEGGSEGIAACLDFSTLAPGTVYTVGQTFSLQGVLVTVLPFQWSNMVVTPDGTAMVVAGNEAGGISPEININNVNLGFDFGGPVNRVELRFVDHGGNCNIQANNNFVNTEDFTGLSLPGLAINVVAGMGVPGFMQLQGATMHTDPFSLDPMLGNFNFIIGGQEFWIDDVCSYL